MTNPLSTPSSDSGPQIDAAIRQYLHSPQVIQGIRATLRHAIIAVAFEHGRALKIGRLTELLNGNSDETFQDEADMVSALRSFVVANSSQSESTDDLMQIVKDEVTRQLADLKITRNEQ